MAEGVTVKLTGAKEYRDVLRRINPKRNPRVISDALRASGVLMRSKIRSRLSGVSTPSRLGYVTGELFRSVAVDTSNLPKWVDVGIPARLWWFKNHEFGIGRFRKRATVLPAANEAVQEMPQIFLKRWERERDRRGGLLR